MTIKYDSKFEQDLHEGPLSACSFHPDLINYVIERTYEPDFIKGKYIIEAKGRFRDRKEASKYLWIRKVLPEGKELVFIFMNHSTPMPHVKKRKKCGTKLTMGQWAAKNGFLWYTPRTIPSDWRKK